MLAEANKSLCKNGNELKLRTACENCRQSKVKCNLSSKDICIRCLRHGLQCRYGFANRSGKPKGSKNRATLRKMGQLQGEKLADHSAGVGNAMESIIEQKDVTEQFMIPNRGTDNLSFEQKGLSESPIDFNVNATTNGNFTVPNDVSMDSAIALDRSNGSLFDDKNALDFSYDLSAGPGCSQAMSPTLLQRGSGTKGATGFPSALHIPSAVQPTCECFENQISHMNRLSHMVADANHLRFDHCLQSIKATVCACRLFFQCTRCHKDNANLLLSISIFDLTLQLFERWISCKVAPHNSPSDEVLNICYGYYEVCQEENLKIRNFLLRGLLSQCQEVIAMFKKAVDACFCPQKLACLNVDMSPFPFVYDTAAASPATCFLLQSGHFTPCGSSGGLPDSTSCLHQIARRYEASMDCLMQTLSSEDCICEAPRLGGLM